MHPFKISKNFFTALVIGGWASSALATNFSATGTITGTQSANLIVQGTDATLTGDSTNVVVGDAYNTSAYRSLYSSTNLAAYYSPNTIAAPTAFINASSVPNGFYQTQPYNTYTLVVRGAGVYAFQISDPAFPTNYVRTNLQLPTIDLMAGLYVKSGSNTTAFNAANTTENLVALNDDNTTAGLSNPYVLFFDNVSATDCMTITLVYWPWNTITTPAPVQITASGAGQIATSCSSLGPSRADTQAALAATGIAIQSALSMRLAALSYDMDNDCALFDKRGLCIGIGGRYESINGDPGTGTYGLLVGGYRATDHVRVGAWIDKNLSNDEQNAIIHYGTSKPLFGLFGVWTQHPGEQGYVVRVSAGLGDQDLSITRPIVGTSEPGHGDTNLNVQGIAVNVGYDLLSSHGWVVSPYAGLRYVTTDMNGYTEQSSSSVTEPLTYNGLSEKMNIASVGVRFLGRVAQAITARANVGIEQNIDHSNNALTASNADIPGIQPVAINSSHYFCPSASVGLSYELTKSGRIDFDLAHAKEPFYGYVVTTTQVRYTQGF